MARKRIETATESSKEIKASRAKKCKKTTTKKFHESGKHNSEREKSALKCSGNFPSSQVQRSINAKDKAQEVTFLKLHSGKEVQLTKKMKLQLFPLDAHTREGLEKDGFHPYLELTLSTRKKVSSVLKHIHSKWGNSEIAQGHPTLYPYDKSVLASGHKWTVDSNITTSDIYIAIGAPSLFRLRYGWSSEIRNRTDEQPSPSTPGITCFPNEEPQSIISNKTENASFTANQVTDLPHLDEQVEPTGNKTHNESGSTFFSWDDGLTSLSIGGLLSEVSLKGNHSKNSNTTLWVENFTNISIGGLFSEASLQGRQEPTHNDQPSVSIGGLITESQQQQQPLPIISDSLHALLFNDTNQSQSQPQPQAPSPPPPPHSSILDAEDTCHAFSFPKRTKTSHKVLEQVNEEAEEQQQKVESEQPAKGLFGSMDFNQDSSLGFSGIKWAESRGPFDFGLSSSSRKFTNGDSVSFGALVKDLEEIKHQKQ